ncbi:ABC-2 type transporter [Lysobacter dokdonensis DS-58]|uniref:Transport permease protein n=1 Tax=Lysobacter dokdonensis DS-58 TaxID=1300345 RepID=A0A0A2WLV5_9GAMM|nr:ABC transporter permease [Lysobacter dokdonensis]KGQ20798.1 ABC-2 type transporter [Lysobacter dokdonensis DS-58]
MHAHARRRTGLGELIASAWRHRELTASLSRREVVGRYRGSVIGIAWSFFNPLLMLAVYTFVFSVVFKARWGVALEDAPGGFALILFVGIIVHAILAECLGKAPALILGNANYVKRVIFPLEVLPWVTVWSALFHAGISTLVLIVVRALLVQSVPWTVVFFPLILAPYAVLLLGLTSLLAAIGVYVRDIAQIVGIVTAAMMFLAPVFYPITAIPEAYRPLLYLNPVTWVVEQSRAVLIAGQMPDWTGFCIYSLVAIAVAWFGFWWFQRSRVGFADVL